MNASEMDRMKIIIQELSTLIKEVPKGADEKFDKLLDEIVEIKKYEHGQTGRMCCRSG